MITRYVLVLLVWLLAAPAAAQPAPPESPAVPAPPQAEREQDLYAEAQDAVAEGRYERALGAFDRLIQLKGTRIDAALYWKAYAQNRLGQRAEALTTLSELLKQHPSSRYARSAAVLEAEVRRDVGQPVPAQAADDDEIRLIALQSLQHRDPEQAIPLLQKVLDGTSGPKVKARALFVLAQSDTPRAREVLRSYATGSSTPDLQLQAIRYLGVHGGQQNRAVLGDVYAASQDVDVKRRILRAFAIAGDRDRLLNAARGEPQEALRAEAVAQLGVMNAHAELWDLYQKEATPAVRRRIIRAMHAGGSVDRLVEIARTEQDPELRREAVRTLGLTPAGKTADTLVQIYGADRTPETRKAVIQALFIQGSASALVALARKEQDPALRRELVEKLSRMESKAAADYMLELLGK